jgi:hypothetical protein
MKWMKWIGRSLVERAAATTLLDLQTPGIAGSGSRIYNERIKKIQHLLRVVVEAFVSNA